MRRVLRLARRIPPTPSSRPRLAVLVVAKHKVVGEGRSDESRGALSEALNLAGSLARGATIYANTDPLIDAPEAGLLSRLASVRPRRVVVGGIDAPALRRLRGAGVEVVTGALEAECGELNEAYAKHRRTGLPFVTLKFAQSLDGRIATGSGESKWISGPESLRLAHRLRSEHDAILVGIGTILADDPQLTTRLVNGRNPTRIILDSRLRIPADARVLMQADRARTLVYAMKAGARRVTQVRRLGAEVVTLPERRGGVSLRALLVDLGARGIASVLVEGGAGVITSFLAEGLADRLVVAIAPKIVGRGTDAIGDLGVARLSDAITFSSVKTRKLGSDLVFEGRLAARPGVKRARRAALR